MLTSLIGIFSHTVFQSSWSTLLRDKPFQGVEVSRLKFVPEIPVNSDTKNMAIRGDPIASAKNILVMNEWNLGLFETRPPNFRDQAMEHLGGTLPSEDIEGSEFVFYFETPSDQLKLLDEPFLFFFRIIADWEVFQNGRSIGKGSRITRYPMIPVTIHDQDPTQRFTFVVKNGRKNLLSRMDFLHGISIRSAKDAAWAQRTLPMQHELPRIVAAIFFLCFALFSTVLAFSMPRYTDLWALAAFCGAMFFVIWATTPFYWESYDWSTGRSDSFILMKGLSRVAVTITAACLSLSFFRIKGHYLKLILGIVTLWATWTMASNWPWGNEMPSYKQTAIIDAQLVRALWSSQLIIFAVGFYHLRDAFKTYKARGLEAMLPPMKRQAALTNLLSSIQTIVTIKSHYRLKRCQQRLQEKQK